jgi:hypothetical protein
MNDTFTICAHLGPVDLADMEFLLLRMLLLLLLSLSLSLFHL